MALKEYVGAIVLEVDGAEYEVIDLNVEHDTGKKLVKTMNKTGRALGFHKGVETFELSVTAAIPKDDPKDWEAVEGAKLTIYPASDGGQRESYSDCVCISAGRKYSVENEARVDLKFLALGHTKE
ncbi:hypothetical protein NNJEOMEG_02267 [Fundidesulfovibrio magnetotacticus]|uniref:Phage tail protein n=1 Tax=Fundidesulfovibrio magnetotacticus TaxID=2730080 RepID=A0A6V8LPE3_9BACT|nr:phage tail protein [Fundidesulfovibrio magnetotacticus]GFK94422.1 hypothetical protein NNJEOMEG_02267 [Fundidesulfovibrio magnetotacticus]